MIISYNWLSEYLPVTINPEKLSAILTSIGLEVESLHPFESFPGGLKGLVVGEVLSCEKHPDADKLKITNVTTGNGQTLQIVCGASNVAAGQKVVVAPIGTTIYPIAGEPVTMKKAKIRGVESQGMICAEDEIGTGSSHEGILVLDPSIPAGTAVSTLFNGYSDYIYEIGLTPNRIDAMSHIGVARDVCAWWSYHEEKGVSPKYPYADNLVIPATSQAISVTIEDPALCSRYAGIRIDGIKVGESPEWLKQRLQSIGLKSINNIVDATNFILHETGQPLHAFDAAKISSNKIIVKNAVTGSVFKTLDDKERKMNGAELMIADAERDLCLAGVYGGADSGVTDSTATVFLESAWFAPASIRRTSVNHGLRTDAATHFEKGVDISNTVTVLKRAAKLITDLAGGQVSDLVDMYPNPPQPQVIGLKYHFLKKLSGKHYHQDAIKQILTALGFTVLREGVDEISLQVPFSKPDVKLPADIVEEIMRIDGLDNVEIPRSIQVTPSVNKSKGRLALKEKIAEYLAGNGFYEIFTNSITNSAYYTGEELATSVKMINNLSSALDIMRPRMLETGLEVISHNINRKNSNLRLFEFGKTYHTSGTGEFREVLHLALYITGNVQDTGWSGKAIPADFYYLKGIVENISRLIGTKAGFTEQPQNNLYAHGLQMTVKKQSAGTISLVSPALAGKFDIKDQVFHADLEWDILTSARTESLTYREISKYPVVERDLALVVDRSVTYGQIEAAAKKLQLAPMRGLRLFDIFESEKLGAGKKSMAVSFSFGDDTKTLVDNEVDGMMQKLIGTFEKELGALIRK